MLLISDFIQFLDLGVWRSDSIKQLWSLVINYY